MANKTKKISINAFEKAVKENYPQTETVEWNGLEIEIKRTLSFGEMLAFVDSVTKSCFGGEDEVYQPQAKDFAIRWQTVELYTNITLPSNPKNMYELLYGCDIVNVVTSYINKSQFNAMVAAVEDNIAYTAKANIASLEKQIDDMYGKLNSMEEQLSSIFSGIGADDLKNIIGAISNGELDEEKLVKAYIDNQQANN